MNITTIGACYVGLVTSACLSEIGIPVACLDSDEFRNRSLNSGAMPILEHGLESLIHRNKAGCASPAMPPGRSAIVRYCSSALAHSRTRTLIMCRPPHAIWASDRNVIVHKSTVRVGTTERKRDAVASILRDRGVRVEFSVLSNPESLKDGAAADDFMHSDQIIFGAGDGRAIALISAVYALFAQNRDKFLLMDVRSADCAKDAANAMLATRIGLVNDLAPLTERVGAGIELVRRGVGSDPRIGNDYFYADAGCGGNCFPKDVSALIRNGADRQVRLGILAAVEVVRECRKGIRAEKVVKRFGDLLDKAFAFWGLSFKPNTDAMREAPGRVIGADLVRRGAHLNLYDLAAMPQARLKRAAESQISFFDGADSALEEADGVLIVTEWRKFKNPYFDAIRKRLEQPLIFDGRSLFDSVVKRSFSLEHHAIRRGDWLKRVAGGTQ
ncbi:MAG: nucleotide sugar dehydrogenase [Burkholderiales bacterium]